MEIYRTYCCLVKLKPWLLSLRWKTCLWAKLQPCCLSSQWKIWLWGELQPWLLSLQWKTCLWAKPQPWFLSLQWKTCSWAEHTNDADFYIDVSKKLNIGQVQKEPDRYSVRRNILVFTYWHSRDTVSYFILFLSKFRHVLRLDSLFVLPWRKQVIIKDSCPMNK